MLDYLPVELRVRVIRCTGCRCRACAGDVVKAPAPERPIDSSLATEVLLVHVLVNKYADQRPHNL